MASPRRLIVFVSHHFGRKKPQILLTITIQITNKFRIYLRNSNIVHTFRYNAASHVTSQANGDSVGVE